MPAIPRRTNRTSLVQQIADTFIKDIEKGLYKKDEKLLSINDYSRQFGVARDTIEKAYAYLGKAGYITSVKGRGNFVIGKPDTRINVLLLFNKISSYKKIVYDTIISTLGDRARVDIFVHHYNPDLLAESIEGNLGKYHYYVIMPHFYQGADEQNYLNIIKKIPATQLMFLDRDIPHLVKRSAVYQDFTNDVYNALNSVTDLIGKYQQLITIVPLHEQYAFEITRGIERFTLDHHITHEVVAGYQPDKIEKGNLYIVLSEDDLVLLIKEARQRNFTLGADIGIISYNDTPFKELLNISVLSTDFEEMGKTTAQLILKNEAACIKNPFELIIRESL